MDSRTPERGVLRELPRPPHRIAVSVALGVLGFALSWLAQRASHPAHADWPLVYHAAHALLAGQDPYAVVRYGPYPLYYPLTAVVPIVPLTAFPLIEAQALWVGLGTGVLGYALTARGWWALLAFASAPCLNAFLLGQWSPLLVGASAVPWLGFLWATKPTIGLAYLAAWPSRKAVIGVLLLTALSLALDPTWPVRWLAVLEDPQHIRAPVTRLGGILLLLGLLRWRQPEGRLLATMALVPHTSGPYELVPLFLVPLTVREMGILVILSQLAFAVCAVRLTDPTIGLAGIISAQWPVWLAAVYLPALAMVLRRAPVPMSPR